ncbi:hypothetical protein EYF80_010259 [Liparis tanakae]|uniref:Uncharacterized protein n=1 Tax=Liparis tanakae TaxID=230148 RepID=A0A4Z2INJ3_9TELE|nr:hypothetical protein EYF80_010259 [Liparis tanakae]
MVSVLLPRGSTQRGTLCNLCSTCAIPKSSAWHGGRIKTENKGEKHSLHSNISPCGKERPQQAERGTAAIWMMMPLSVEKLSDGRPAMVHPRIFTGSPREFIRDMLGEHGISLLLQRFIHSSV